MKFVFAGILAGLLLLLAFCYVPIVEGQIQIDSVARIAFPVDTNHIYSLWVSQDATFTNWYEHPACKDYRPTYNRLFIMYRPVEERWAFFRLDTDGVPGPIVPQYVIVTNIITTVTNFPPVPVS